MKYKKIVMASGLGFLVVSHVPAAWAEGKTKQKTPSEVSKESSEENPDLQGMEEDDEPTEIGPDKSTSETGIGLDRNPMGSKKKSDDETSDPTEDLDEAADDILDKSFSQPGYDQDTGESVSDRTGEAAIAVPKKSKTPTVDLRKEKFKPQKQKPTVVITDKAVILKIQKALIKRGEKLEADGKMGQSTVAAIKSFQKKHGLKPDGSPGPATLAKLGIVYIKN